MVTPEFSPQQLTTGERYKPAPLLQYSYDEAFAQEPTLFYEYRFPATASLKTEYKTVA